MDGRKQIRELVIGEEEKTRGMVRKEGRKEGVEGEIQGADSVI